MLSWLHAPVDGLLEWCFPATCLACGDQLPKPQDQVCFYCRSQLPKTGFSHQPGNPIEQLFWGRLPVQAAHSEYYFTKGGRVQKLIHQLKYHQCPDAGRWLGEEIGRSLLASERFTDLTGLVPLPLHPKKEQARGYNQAAMIAEGIATVLAIPVQLGVVARARATETQTRKHRLERWENVADGFAINRPLHPQPEHFLLIDDVVTTGASLEACGQAIVAEPNWKLSVATVTFAQR